MVHKFYLHCNAYGRLSNNIQLDLSSSGITTITDTSCISNAVNGATDENKLFDLIVEVTAFDKYGYQTNAIDKIAAVSTDAVYSLSTIEGIDALNKSPYDIHCNDDMLLYKFCKQGFLGAIDYLISNGADINSGNGRCLKCAVETTNVKIVNYLIEKGADIYYDAVEIAKTKEEEGLRWYNKNKEIFNILDMRVRCKAIVDGASEGSLETVQYFVATTDTSTITTNSTLNSLIYATIERAYIMAATNGNLHILKWFDNVFRWEHIKSYRQMAAVVACADGNMNVLEYLISMGVDIHANDDELFRCASNNNQANVLDYLSSLNQ